MELLVRYRGIEAANAYPKHSCDFPERKRSVRSQVVSIRTRALLTNEMQLLMEPVAWFDMLSDARRFRTGIWSGVN